MLDKLAGRGPAELGPQLLVAYSTGSSDPAAVQTTLEKTHPGVQVIPDVATRIIRERIRELEREDED